MRLSAFFAILLLGCAGVAAPAIAADDLGRLFLTPQQRQDLDRRRAANIQEAQVVQQESTLTVQGRVSRSSGRTTTWINGVPQHDSYRGADPSQVNIPGGEGQPDVTMKIGQTHDNVRGEIRDGLGGGKIEVSGGQRRTRKP
jgi:hypothetical protein